MRDIESPVARSASRINRFHVEQFTYFLNRLKTTRDGDGSLLDHSMIVYGSGLSDGNRPCWRRALGAELRGRLIGLSTNSGKIGNMNINIPRNNPGVDEFRSGPLDW